MVQRLKSDLGPDWLIQFTEGQNNFGGFSYLLYRRLPVLLPRMKIGRIDCKSSSELCRYVDDAHNPPPSLKIFSLPFCRNLKLCDVSCLITFLVVSQ